MGPPTRAAAIMIQPGFVFKQRKKSPSFPFAPAISRAHTALHVSLIALPSEPSRYVMTKADKAAVLGPYQSAHIPFVIPSVINAEYSP